MKTDKLILMANQIGDFYEAYPYKTEAECAQVEKEIANHLTKFWNSIMKNSIVAHVKTNDGTGLHPRVKAAIANYLN